MAHGGKRSGAGRKKGSETRKTRLIAAAAVAEGITPIQVMLSVMRMAYEKGDYATAANIAKDAAPYTTPRLSSMVAKVEGKQDTTVTFIDDFYRRMQAHSPAESNGAPIAGLDSPGAHEGNGVRPALGQNGVGPHSDSGGPR